MATITSGILTFTPSLITAWAVSQTSRNVVHEIMMRATPDVTLKPASSRSGTLDMLFSSSTEAEAARVALAAGTVFTISGAETWLEGFTFVASGTISATLDDSTRVLWTVSADFREVSV